MVYKKKFPSKTNKTPGKKTLKSLPKSTKAVPGSKTLKSLPRSTKGTPGKTHKGYRQKTGSVMEGFYDAEVGKGNKDYINKMADGY